jgi:hypothetical protein
MSTLLVLFAAGLILAAIFLVLIESPGRGPPEQATVCIAVALLLPVLHGGL